MTKKLLLSVLFLMLSLAALQAITECPTCHYRVEKQNIECPRCLKLLKWPFAPPRSRKGKIVVRSGSDAFIRHPQAQNRAFKADRNAGGDISGQIGSWGGQTALRYLIRFDVKEAFVLAKANIAAFKLKRATLRFTASATETSRTIRVCIHPLNRPFTEGTGFFREREKKIDGCSWFYSAPMLPWYSEGGDYDATVISTGSISQGSQHESLIDVTEVMQYRFDMFCKTGEWNDPGMIIMGATEASQQTGFVTVFSMESRAIGENVRAPELFLE